MGLLIGGTLFSFAVVFMFCEFGEQLRRRFDEINNAICDLDWYTFPPHVQRMIPTILLSAQNPPELMAYGGVSSSRITFKAVSFNIHFTIKLPIPIAFFYPCENILAEPSELIDLKRRSKFCIFILFFEFKLTLIGIEFLLGGQRWIYVFHCVP